MRLLLVEDDEFLAQSLRNTLVKQNYVVDIATDGEEGWDYAQAFAYDLMLLDISLPKLDGISLCRRLRRAKYNSPILILTAKNDSENKVIGLDAGADDYVVKPCTIQELLARIRALLRRLSTSSDSVLTWGNLSLDTSSYEVNYEEKLINLSPKEFALLELFLHYPKRVFSRNAILEHLWSFEDPPNEDTVRAHIKGLRRKLKTAEVDNLIETVYGIGYRLKPSPDKQRPIPNQNQEIKEQTINAVNKAWGKFKKPIIERITTLEQAVQSISLGNLTRKLLQEAQQQAHKLAGSLGMFGFLHASHIARKIEHYLEQIEKQESNELSSSTIAIEKKVTSTEITENISISKLQSMIANLRQELEEKSPSGSASALVNLSIEHNLDQISSSHNQEQKTPLLLVVDNDESLTQQLLTEALKWNIRLEVALNSTQARIAIAEEFPDIVLLDLAFPSSNNEGLILLEELTNKFPELPVLVFTVQDGFSDRLAVARLGGRAFLSKPITPVQILEAVQNVLQRSHTSEAKVMAVDDDPLLLDVVRQFLQPWGLQLTTLEDSSKFWRTLETCNPDILILDVEMPQFNGIELCQVVRNDPTWNSLSILFLTSHTDAETIHRIYQAGADDYVSKPITEPELVNRIFNRLERARLLKSLAETDQLAGISNHYTSKKELNRYLHLSMRHNQPLCLAILDLDFFKQVNDHYGHLVGDKVIKRLGVLLRQHFRNEDIVARLNDDKFIIGMYGLNKESGVRRLNEVLEIVRGEIFSVAGAAQLKMTVSAGIAQYPENGSQLQSLYQAANQALSLAKENGGNQTKSATS